MHPIVSLLSLLAPSPLALVKGATKRQGATPGASSSYAAALPRQAAHVGAVGMQPSITGRTGSEDWSDQTAAGRPSAGYGLPELVGPNGRARVPGLVGMFRAHLPADLLIGRGTGYLTGAYPKGWIAAAQAGRSSWGGSAGLAAARPNVQRGTLLEPTDVTPRARAIAAAYSDQHSGRSRLSDMFGD